MGLKKKKSGKTEVVVKKAGQEQKKEAPLEERDKKFDFGGLPDRDLKKNLGC